MPTFEEMAEERKRMSPFEEDRGLDLAIEVMKNMSAAKDNPLENRDLDENSNDITYTSVDNNLLTAENKAGFDEIILRDVAQRAGEMLRAYAFDMGEITLKHADDPVTGLDKRVEQAIKEDVLSRMPANFIGEEFGKEDNNANCTWIIDPIDGTKSMIFGEFNTSLSIGVEQDGELIAGCVYDFMRDIMYVGHEKKLQVYHNGICVRQSKMPGGKHRIAVDGDNVRDTVIVKALQKLDDVRIIEKNGSIALAMAQVAAGVYDGMVYQTSKRWNAWDIAGGLYLLNCTGVALSQDFKPIALDSPQQAIIGMNNAMLPALLAAYSHSQDRYR
jgi:myo-inositol-1(or 4)-monophosphatase